METQNYEIVTAKSNIDWVGRKATGSHNGTIGIKLGTLSFDNGRLSGGRFVIDTTSIKVLDVTDPAANQQFAGHLASDDFFNSNNFPESALVITSVERGAANSYRIQGDLTIKGITRPVAFDA